MAIMIGLLGLCITGVVIQTREYNAGRAWCEQRGGQELSDTTRVICVGSDDKLISVPTDKDGSWP